MQFPEGLRELTVPYVEASMGIENILKLLELMQCGDLHISLPRECD